MSAVIDVAGSDARLAEAVKAQPGSPIRFAPDETSDVARAVGITAEHGGAPEPITVDVLHVGENDRAVNMVVLGPAPDHLRRDHRSHHCRVEVDGRLVLDGPCTTVVVANGEYLRGLDVVPRGHPGDGRFEVHAYAVPAGERRQMRSRLRTGTHVPHPGIITAQGTTVVVQWDGPVRQEIDGVGRAPTRSLEVTLGAGELTLVP